MKNVAIFAFVLLSFLWVFSARAEIASVRVPYSNSHAPITKLTPIPRPEMESNNVRLFPLKYYHRAIHLGFERALSKHFVVGLEASYMAEYLISYFYIHRPGERYRENFAGILGQYFLTQSFDGIYIEAGLNYLKAEVEMDNGGSSPVLDSSTFAYPFLSAGYRFKLPFGLNFGAGGGLGMYVGNTLATNHRIESPYYNGRIDQRIRADIGYAF